jgi:hypothetical protein
MSNLMFDRIVSIDWSGAGSEEERVSLRIAVWEKDGDCCRIRLPPASGTTRKWRRSECRDYLRQVLSDAKRTLVGMDFGFGLPWGSEIAIFRVRGWREMIKSIGQLYEVNGTARAAAQVINSMPHLNGHGPYRFNDSRTDYRFYLDNGVPYYRLTELAAPQAISQWYMGSGGTVAFHTITGLAAIDWLISLRHKDGLRFAVWPFEEVEPNQNVLVETYPAICPKCAHDPSCHGGDEIDAWRVLQMIVAKQRDRTLTNLFEIREQPFGRIAGVNPRDQIRFEGSIFGLQ